VTYSQYGKNKAVVGINGQNGYLPRYTEVPGKDGQYNFGAFIPSVSLMSGYYHRLSNLPGVDTSKHIFSHSHPGDNGNPEASVPDRNTARASWLSGTFQVSSKGVYKIISRE